MKLLPAVLALSLSSPCLAGIAPHASFDEPLAPPSTQESQVHFAIYGWLQSLDGDVTVAGTTTPLNLDFGDIVRDLDLSLMGAAGVNHGRWGILVDFNYAELSANLTTPLGIVAPFINFRQEQWLVNAVGSYALIRNPDTELDIYAGLRLNALEVELAFNTRRGARRLTGDQEWIDPIVGLRFQQELPNSFFFRAVGDIGGFGVSSEFTWQAMAAFGWRFRDNGSFLLGYRAIDSDYQQGTFAWDVNAHGPILGWEFTF